jgi:polysaccharide biosynthesis/export protein
MALRIYLCIVCLSVISCRSVRESILFKTDHEHLPAGLAQNVQQAERNYTIQQNDYLEIFLYSNKGERLIDFNIQNNAAGSNTPGTTQAVAAQGPRFLVQENGYVRLPQVGMMYLEGLTLHQADSVLEKAYTTFYIDPFVNTKFANKRVVVLSANQGQVVPLVNENMNLIEVIALSGGVQNNEKASNIRLIRGDLNNPEVHIIDLSTIEGMAKANLRVQPNDIIYVEPVRRAFIESLQEITPVISIVSSVVAIAVLIVASFQ